MKKKIDFQFIFPIGTLIVLIFGLSNQMFNIPPLGKFINPFIGIIHNDNESQAQLVSSVEIKDSVNVYYDSRKVPHIYATNLEDLYFTQGYVTASLRLWEMDFISYASAGRMSEIFDNETYLEYDRTQRRIGILDAAKKSLKLIEKDENTINALDSYTKGINAYLNSLNYKNMPIEYKLLDYEPETWTNLKTVLILKSMANTLTGFDDDFNMSKMFLALGKEKFNKFFPQFDNHTVPVMNNNKPDSIISNIYNTEYLDYSFLSSSTNVLESSYNPKLGSNCWAVSGKKTLSGNPILCNDPHLGLAFPSIWIEMQLSSPEVNVYGVSIPGTPGIIIGFNSDIAWGVTNGSTDVKDWYKLKITENYKSYVFDGKLKKLDYKVEEIKRKNADTFFDTIYHSLQGPIVYDKNFKPEQQIDYLNFSLKWELHNASNEFKTFLLLNRAKTFNDYKIALKGYSCPIQNFTFINRTDTIAITHQGKLANKWKGQGKFILDGSKSSHLYDAYIPNDSLPQLINPNENYVLSANQHPTYSNYKYYYNGYFGEYRSNRINDLLKDDDKFTCEKMKQIQLDNTNYLALKILPVLIKRLKIKSLNDNQKKFISKLSKWDCSYDQDTEFACFYEAWMEHFRESIWNELQVLPFYSRQPDDFVLLNLLETKPNSVYFDKKSTSLNEDANDIATQSFLIALKKYNKYKINKSVKWGDMDKISILHLTNIEAFSELNIASSSSPDAINATSENWGPSWRMIVELGERPLAYGIYPGGQSGNVGGKYYDNFVKDWSVGLYYKLNYYLNQKEAKKEAVYNCYFKK